MKIKSFPIVNTERLTLRKIDEADSDSILFLRSDKTINKYIDRPENRKTRNLSDAVRHIKKLNREFEDNISFSWGITLQNKSNIIGTICLWNFSQNNKVAEVGFELNPLFQRKGIMSEALLSVLDYGFNKLNLEKVEAFTHNQNESSKGLLIKNRFELLKTKKDKDNPFNIVFEIKRVENEKRS